MMSQNIENGFPHPIRRRAYPVIFWGFQFPAAQASANNPHPLKPETRRMAAQLLLEDIPWDFLKGIRLQRAQLEWPI